MFEHRRQPLLSRAAFLKRLAAALALALAAVTACLGIGMLGYRHFEGMGWIDAFVNASMILSGMGPVAPLRTESGKIFAGAYALFSGLAFLTSAAVGLSPAVHRFFHVLHLEGEESEKRG